MKKTLAFVASVLYAVANLFTLGALARRARKKHGEAQRALFLEQFAELSKLRRFRRALHYASTWKAINRHPRTRHLPRPVRRAAAREAAKAAFRRERGLPDIISRSHIRRLRRGYFDPALVMPVRADGMASVTASA